MRQYKVYTQHQGAAFHTPIEVEADSPLEAAQTRFSWQVEDSREETYALLVVAEGSAHVFPVVPEVKTQVVEIEVDTVVPAVGTEALLV